MKSVSMLDFRLHAEKIISQVQKGQRVVLTRRGKPVARLEPIEEGGKSSDDPIYGLADLGDEAGESLDNSQIDEILYGK